MTRMRTWIVVAACASGTVCCGSSSAPTPTTTTTTPTPTPTLNTPATISSSSAAPAEAAGAPAATNPVPTKLEEVAAQFGMTMQGDWEWAELERMRTRFDWSGRPKGRAHEARWSFWMKGEDVRASKPFLPQIVQSAAMNLTQSKACEPFDQPADIAKIVGADRVITVCFEPTPYVSKELHQGVLHGLLRGDVLVIVIVLANDRTGIIPLPDYIGGRFRP